MADSTSPTYAQTMHLMFAVAIRVIAAPAPAVIAYILNYHTWIDQCKVMPNIAIEGTCNDPEAKDYACRLLAMHERGEIRLKHNHFSADGNDPYDGASALSNVRDTCYGRQAKRSNYCAAAPGGCVCLKGAMLRTMHTYATNFRSQYGQAIDVNAIAGSCHSSTSWHYQGNTWDISCSTPL